MTGDALLPAGQRSLLFDPLQILEMLGLQREESQRQKQARTGDAPRGRQPAFKGSMPSYMPQPAPTMGQYMDHPGDYPSVARTVARIPAFTGPSIYRGSPTAEQSPFGMGVSINTNHTLPRQALNAVLPRDFNINIQDQRPGGGPTVPNVAEAILAANPNLAAAAAMQPQAGAPQAPESAPPLQTGGVDTSVPPIAALDPSFGQPTPQAIVPPTVEGMPQIPLSPEPQLQDLPPVQHNFISGGPSASAPVISAPAPAPAPVGPGGPTAMLRFPIGHTPAISMGSPTPYPATAMGGPTRAETVPPAALVRPHIQIGGGYRAPAPAPSYPVTPPIDDALTGMEANRRFMSGPGPGTSLEYPPPSLPSSPAPAAPATIAPSPPPTVPDTGAAVPPDFEDNLIKAALLLSAKRKAMAAGAHG